MQPQLPADHQVTRSEPGLSSQTEFNGATSDLTPKLGSSRNTCQHARLSRPCCDLQCCKIN